jgi:hypothetical protein
MRFLFSVGLLPVLLLIPIALGDRVSCDAVWRTDYITVTEDATISELNPMTNHGQDLVLKTRYKSPPGASWRERFLLKLPTVQGQVSSVLLRLRVNNTGPTVSVHRVLSGWSEDNVTWSNCPPFENSPLLLLFPPAMGYWAELNLTGLDAPYGLLFRLADENASGNNFTFFDSSENLEYAPYVAVTRRPEQISLSLSCWEQITKPQIVVGVDNEVRVVRIFTVANNTGWDAENVVVWHEFPENTVWCERNSTWVGRLPNGGQYTGQVSYVQSLPMPECVENRAGYHRFRFFLPRAITPADTRLSIRVVIPQVVVVSKVLVNGVEVPFTVSRGSTVVVADASSLSLPAGEGFVEVYWSIPTAGAVAPAPTYVKPSPPPPAPPPTPAPLPSFILLVILFPLFLLFLVLALAGMGMELRGRYPLLGILVSSVSLLAVAMKWGMGILLLAFGGLFFLDDLLIHTGVLRGMGFELRVGGVHVHHAYIGLSLLTSAVLTLLGAPLVATVVAPLAVLVSLVVLAKKISG